MVVVLVFISHVGSEVVIELTNLSCLSRTLSGVSDLCDEQR